MHTVSLVETKLLGWEGLLDGIIPNLGKLVNPRKFLDFPKGGLTLE